MDLTKTALVLIDLQKESKYGVEGLESIVANTKKLLTVCRSMKIPIIHTRQINRADSVGLSYGEPLDETGKPLFYCSDTESIEIMDDVAPLDHEIVIDKYRWSGFYETHLDLMLKSLGVEHLIIGGLVTDGCLLTSVFDGYFRNYQIHLVKDICGATNPGAHMASILIMANWVYGIKIYEADEIIKHLNGEDFKVWESTFPDEMQFTPENMREMFNLLGSNKS